ncbi:MAG: hypothetical protein AMS17_02640 [Spirochaetes bacterium DG_61]|nr:MAG: hypothetical protein AMS17_02640 [Spirochaetes bacterium DG_61]
MIIYAALSEYTARYECTAETRQACNEQFWMMFYRSLKEPIFLLAHGIAVMIDKRVYLYVK